MFVMSSTLFCSPRSGGLVDYDDDDDDDNYRPPPKKQLETPEEDEGTSESLRMKRKLPSKDKEPDLVKKQQLGKHSKPKESVYAALCSTLSHAVLPSTKAATTKHTTPLDENKGPVEESHKENDPVIYRSSDYNSNSGEENHREKDSAGPKSCSDCLHSTSENGQIIGDDGPLISPPKSSPEMAVNGS